MIETSKKNILPNSIIVPLVGCKLKDDLIIDEANLTIKQKLHVIDNDNIKFVTMQNIKYLDGYNDEFIVCEPKDVEMFTVPMSNPPKTDIKIFECIITPKLVNDHVIRYKIKEVLYNNIAVNDTDMTLNAFGLGLNTGSQSEEPFRNKTLNVVTYFTNSNPIKENYTPTVKICFNDEVKVIQKAFYRMYIESNPDAAHGAALYSNFNLEYVDNWIDIYNKDIKITFYATNDEITWNGVCWYPGVYSIGDLVVTVECNGKVHSAGPNYTSTSGGIGELYNFVEPLTTDFIYTIDRKNEPNFKKYFILLSIGYYSSQVDGNKSLKCILIKPIEDGTKLKYVIPNRVMQIYKEATLARGAEFELVDMVPNVDLVDTPTSE